MCLIIHRFDGTNVPNDVLDVNRSRNSDGFGIAWRSQDGELHHAKYGPQAYMKFRKQLKRLDRHPEIEYTAHFRFATTGAPCRDLSHPFEYTDPIEGKVLVFHNGVIDIDAPKGESDTSQFVKAVLAKLPAQWWTQAHLRFLVESSIGSSRMLIMTKTENIFLNEGAWMRKSGILYSTDPGGSHSKYKSTGGIYVSNVTNWSGKGSDTTTKYLSPGTKVTGTPLLTPVAQAIEERSTDIRDFVEVDDLDFGDAQTWMHMGHRVESLGEPISDGAEGTVEAICIECQTIGEVYVIEGNTFIDVPHGIPSNDDENDDDEGAEYERWLRSGASGTMDKAMARMYSV